MELCVICKKNETNRLMDAGWGEKKPVCGECLESGRWRELLPEPLPEATESTPGVSNDLVCSICGRECKSPLGLKSHMRIHK